MQNHSPGVDNQIGGVHPCLTPDSLLGEGMIGRCCELLIAEETIRNRLEQKEKLKHKEGSYSSLHAVLVPPLTLIHIDFGHSTIACFKTHCYLHLYNLLYMQWNTQGSAKVGHACQVVLTPVT